MDSRMWDSGYQLEIRASGGGLLIKYCSYGA